MIINGELESGIGGGVCQVSTTVFNAAFEAGLSIEKRTNHALYISHYPLGRDATVNYPDVDLVFKNDTDKWLLIRTFVGAGSLTVNIYGTPQNRRVETETAPLTVDGKVPWKRIDDDTLFKGQKVVEQWGSPPRSTSVTRRVYRPDGTLLYDTTWRSYYVGEPTVVRLGSKLRPKVTPPPPADTATQPVDLRSSPRTERRRLPRGRRPRLRRPRRRLGPEDVLDEPVGDARRPVRGRVDRGVAPSSRARRARRRARPGTRTRNRAPRISRAAHADRQHVVEHGGPLVLEVDAGRQRLDPTVADRLVAAARTPPGRRRGPPRARRRTTHGGRFPARRSRRSGCGPGA